MLVHLDSVGMKGRTGRWRRKSRHVGHTWTAWVEKEGLGDGGERVVMLATPGQRGYERKDWKTEEKESSCWPYLDSVGRKGRRLWRRRSRKSCYVGHTWTAWVGKEEGLVRSRKSCHVGHTWTASHSG